MMHINQSEILAAKSISSAFKNSFDDLHIFENIVIPLPDGRRVHTAEMDCVVVCNAGVIVFEVKGWDKTFVDRVPVDGQLKKQWILNNPDGVRFHVNDPISQGSEKMIELRQRLPASVYSQYYVVITGSSAQLSGRLPACVLHLNDLPYIARVIRSAIKRSKKSVFLDAYDVAHVVGLISDLSAGHTLQEHTTAVIASKAAHIGHLLVEPFAPPSRQTLSRPRITFPAGRFA